MTTQLPSAGFTGSTQEYWQAHQAQQDAEQRQKTVKKLGSRTKRLSLLYNILAVASIVVFVVGLYLNDWALAALEDNPLVGMDLGGLQRMGGTSTPRIVNKYQYWRLLSSLFINAGVIHIWANLSTIWVYSNFLSHSLRVEHLVILFFTAGIGGVLTSANIGADHVTSAASAPAFGMIGGAIVLLVMRWRRYRNFLVTALVMALSLGINVFIGAMPFVDNSANVAGLVLGALVTASLLLVYQQESEEGGVIRWEGRLQCLASLFAGLAVAILVLGLIGLNTNLPASNCCSELVCTSSPLWNCDASHLLPDGCKFTNYINGTTLIQCPIGTTFTLSGLNGTRDSTQLNAYCSTYCAVAGSPIVPGGIGAAGALEGNNTS